MVSILDTVAQNHAYAALNPAHADNVIGAFMLVRDAEAYALQHNNVYPWTRESAKARVQNATLTPLFTDIELPIAVVVCGPLYSGNALFEDENEVSARLCAEGALATIAVPLFHAGVVPSAPPLPWTPCGRDYVTDLALFAPGPDRRMNVLVIRRGNQPYQGRWALPGGYVESDEASSRHAAAREGAEETGVDIPPAALGLVGVYDAPGRDPRGDTMSVAYTARLRTCRTATAGDDAADAQWRPVDDVLVNARELAFDHADIIQDAYHVATKLTNAW